MKTFQELFLNPPAIVDWSDIVDFEALSDRMSCIDCLYANTLGVNEGTVEWCPNDEPASKEETLAWIWFIRPDLGEEIVSHASDDLKNLITKWNSANMESWWKEMT